MYSFSESLIETGIDMGIEKGIEKGIERSMVKYMNAGHTFDEAFDLFQEPGMDREDFRARITGLS